MSERVALLGQGGNVAGYVEMATDPTLVRTPTTPADFSVLFPTPVDPTEILAMCEETSLWNFIPEIQIGTKSYQWRERTEIDYLTGTITTQIGFDDGACPEPIKADAGSTKSVDLKNIGAYDSLTESDILHAQAVYGLEGLGIKRFVGPHTSEGLPGTDEARPSVDLRGAIAGLMEHRIRLAMTLVINGEDVLLAKGNSSSNSLVFDGLETQITSANGAHENPTANHTGTFSAAEFDRFLSESCVTPQVVIGHPQAIQEMLSAYFQLGFQGSQVIQYAEGNQLVPGFNFASAVNTGVGQLPVVADRNITRTAYGSGGTQFQSSLFALRMNFVNGEPLVFRATQIPLSVKNLTPGCTAVQFIVYKKTALVVRDMCAQNRYTAVFSGRIVTTCPVIG